MVGERGGQVHLALGRFRRGRGGHHNGWGLYAEPKHGNPFATRRARPVDAATLWAAPIPSTVHRILLLLIVGMAAMASPVGASQSWKRALPLPEASKEAVNAANAVINQSGTEECLRGKLSNAIVRLSNSCDVSGHSSTACEMASEIASQESELSMGEMLATSETLLDVLGDQETSH